MEKLLSLFFILSISLGMSKNNGHLNGVSAKPKNVLGTELQSCCTDPMTGFYRDGFCKTGADDYGTHVACCVMTEEFLTFTKRMGNDLSTPAPQYHFPGLVAGDQWCLCALRWREAWQAGFAPPLRLESTHEKMLDYVDLEVLKEFKSE